jgi:MFS family permease
MGISGLFGFGVLSSFIPIKSQLAGLEAWQIGLILTGGALSFSVVSFIIGRLSDKFDRKVFVIISQLVILIGCTGLALNSSFALLLTFYCIFCVGEATTFLLSFVYAAEIFSKENIGSSMGAFDSLMDLSLFIAPLLAILIYKGSGSIPLVIMLGSMPAVITFIGLILWLPREKTG